MTSLCAEDIPMQKVSLVFSPGSVTSCTRNVCILFFTKHPLSEEHLNRPNVCLAVFRYAFFLILFNGTVDARIDTDGQFYYFYLHMPKIDNRV
jgi:hypothetical protein